MSQPCCTATTRDGRPCAARPLPGGQFCLFHDPAHQPALTDSRRQGGATPRRRTRRFPRLLDHHQVGELLGELLIDALNDPTACDPTRLRALTGLANVLLRAVGLPKNTYWSNEGDPEPAVTDPHLLRIYPPEPIDLTRLRDADAERVAELAALQTSDPSHPPAPASAPQPPAPKLQPPTSGPDYNAVSVECERRFHTPPEDVTAWRAAYSAAPDSVVREPDWSRPTSAPRQEWQQEDEQDPNRCGTGAPATDLFSPSPAVASLHEPDPQPDTSAECEASSAARDPSNQTSSPPASVSPCRDGEKSATDTFSVPHVPILISVRRVPGPFG
jgi:hypothetical protein